MWCDSCEAVAYCVVLLLLNCLNCLTEVMAWNKQALRRQTTSKHTQHDNNNKDCVRDAPTRSFPILLSIILIRFNTVFE